MAVKVFVDGQEGTTGLRIHERLRDRQDLDILTIDPQKRKDLDARKELLNEADIAFLCLPDDAARESVALTTSDTRIIDASTAHRVLPDWVYGIPELSQTHRDRVVHAKRVAVPGCHATGFITLTAPLVKEGLIAADAPICCQSITGYTGGGKKMITDFENAQRDSAFDAARFYGLTLQHKHVPEMQHHAGLSRPPLFVPILGDFAQGMTVALPLPAPIFARSVTPEILWEFYAKYYEGQRFVKVLPMDAKIDGGTLNPQTCNGTNRLEIMVFGNDENMMAVARFDNLGKGASGAAVQCMNLMIGAEEDCGLLG